MNQVEYRLYAKYKYFTLLIALALLRLLGFIAGVRGPRKTISPLGRLM